MRKGTGQRSKKKKIEQVHWKRLPITRICLKKKMGLSKCDSVKATNVMVLNWSKDLLVFLEKVAWLKLL